MLISKEEILNTISKMSVTEVMELVSMIEKKFDITSNIPLNNQKISVESNKEEKVSFNVKLMTIGPNKVSIIKIIRSTTGLGLKESKDLVESAPTIIKENITKENADNLHKMLTDAGATAEII
ncbi:50S ribosomal protein L7/L12 [Buchnera aphidicola (Cinara kochiana kochiana)]|uniref:Large ribosomal subunit protein bL12 n=1 Tax=Buchnera aphidicola (Cinara kochiana kochiana) TaxID=2518976 RepID=A0A451D580_9GAMM|nr:50S ribosomal protein L7/L12 [Buchnera aphidicola]VFP80947.1 50S ribosomal protein L7/L12 [Buchnera aphidicola (Cinara kochiana kochiana)]